MNVASARIAILIFLSQNGELVSVAIIQKPLAVIIQAMCQTPHMSLPPRQARRQCSVYAG
jgi:hypothetical protein